MEYEPTDTETGTDLLSEPKCPKEATTKIIKKDQGSSAVSIRQVHIDPNDVIVFDKSLCIDDV